VHKQYVHRKNRLPVHYPKLRFLVIELQVHQNMKRFLVDKV